MQQTIHPSIRLRRPQKPRHIRVRRRKEGRKEGSKSERGRDGSPPAPARHGLRGGREGCPSFTLRRRRRCRERGRECAREASPCAARVCVRTGSGSFAAVAVSDSACLHPPFLLGENQGLVTFASLCEFPLMYAGRPCKSCNRPKAPNGRAAAGGRKISGRARKAKVTAAAAAATAAYAARFLWADSRRGGRHAR